MFPNIILFIIVIILLIVLLRYSKYVKEDFFNIPVPGHQEYIEDSQKKFNHLTNIINLTDPQVSVNPITAKDVIAATGGLETSPTPQNYSLDTKSNYIIPDKLPSGLEIAQGCQAAPKTCAAFDDPSFALNCGISFDKEGLSSDGKIHKGGLFVLSDDREEQIKTAQQVLQSRIPPYDPYKVYQPTMGSARPGTFSLTKDQCIIVKEKVDCEEKQTFDSPNCTQCFTSLDFSRVGRETPRIPFTMYIAGNGIVTIRGRGGFISDVTDYVLSTSSKPLQVTFPSNSEGKEFRIWVRPEDSTKKRSPTFISGYIEGETARGTFKVDLNTLIHSDDMTRKKPRINGNKRINDFRCLSIIPDTGQQRMALLCLVPFSFLNIYEYDAITCDNGPIITTADSATFLESDPCFGKANKPGNYKLECLQTRWSSLGGLPNGTGYPSTKEKADAIQRDSNGNPLTITQIVDELSIKMNKAVSGMDENGRSLSIPEWNEVSMWGVGIPINTPCDGINKDSGPLTKECLSYLYRNQGVTSHIGSTYTMNPGTVASLKNSGLKEGWQNVPNTFNYPGTKIDPNNSAGLSFADNLDGVSNVKQTFDQINRIANDNTKQNLERSTAISQAYGIKLDAPSVNIISGPEQVFAVGPGYQYTKAEAPSICAKYGARVASTAELAQAQLNGADWCFSGWVSDSSTGKWPITTSAIGGCGGRQGIIEWTPGDRAGVNCIGRKPARESTNSANILPFNPDLWNQPSEPTYITVKSGYLETNGPQPYCFNGLSPEDAKKACNNLGGQCVGFSYSKDGTGNGCFKGNHAAGMNGNPAYMGYVKTPLPKQEPIFGRYVRLDYNRVECLNLAQIFVYSYGGMNAIRSSTKVTKSSGYQGDMYPSANFVNQKGNQQGNFVHTSCGDVPWIEVDLGETMYISKIVVWNRADCCQARILGTVLSVLNEDREKIYVSNPIQTVNQSYTWMLPNGQVFPDRDPMPPPPPPKVASFFEHCDYQGAVSRLRPGRYNIGQMGIRNDSISSLRVPPGLWVSIYEHANFSGQSRHFSSDVRCLVNHGFNDVTSSIVVHSV